MKVVRQVAQYNWDKPNDSKYLFIRDSKKIENSEDDQSNEKWNQFKDSAGKGTNISNNNNRATYKL